MVMKWIKTSKQLPEDDDIVLIYPPVHNWHIARYHKFEYVVFFLVPYNEDADKTTPINASNVEWWAKYEPPLVIDLALED